MKPTWAADVPVSMPEPARGERKVPMYGFAFTEMGLFADLTEDEHEEVARPTFGPVLDPSAPTVWGDSA